MKKLEFRLQKVMEYRALVEGWAKDAYLDAKSQRLEGEAALLAIQNRRYELLATTVRSIEDRLALENALSKLDDDERAQKAVIHVLEAEEADAMEKWKQAKQDYEVLVKMREKAVDQWNLEVTREEQAALDEWAVLRRAA